ncbi:MAG: hypothetical protein HYU36_02065 [Planctomycetes bacterium]|nr:hypothetical protein [Planctomycetota bacterium]
MGVYRRGRRGTQREEEQKKSEIVDHTGDAVFEAKNVEVDQEAKIPPADQEDFTAEDAGSAEENS